MNLMIALMVFHVTLIFDCLILFCQWISHRNHRGNICGVDFIWLLNPNKHRKLLRTSWMEAVFGIVKVVNTVLLAPKVNIFR
jgi:hypothetical protein